MSSPWAIAHAKHSESSCRTPFGHVRPLWLRVVRHRSRLRRVRHHTCAIREAVTYWGMVVPDALRLEHQ